MEAMTFDGAPTTPAHPGEDFEKLDAFIGFWRVHGTAHAADKTNQMRGTETFEWLEGRRFLIYKWDREVANGRHVGQGVIGFDNKSEKYFMSSFDNLGYARVYEAEISDGALVLTGPHERARITIDELNILRAHWEIASDDGKWAPLCELVGHH